MEILDNPEWAVLSSSALILQYGTFILGFLCAFVALVRWPRLPRR